MGRGGVGREVAGQTREICPKIIALAALLELDFRSFVFSERFSQLHNRRVFAGAWGKRAQKMCLQNKATFKVGVCAHPIVMLRFVRLTGDSV